MEFAPQCLALPKVRKRLSFDRLQKLLRDWRVGCALPCRPCSSCHPEESQACQGRLVLALEAQLSGDICEASVCQDGIC